MTSRDIIRMRLANQQITGTAFSKPWEMVSWFGAMQAQEYAMAKWAIGLRLPTCHDDEVEHAFNQGKILRTHILRPTWHFISPADIRWMLALSAPRVHAANGFFYKFYGLDENIKKRSGKILAKALANNRHLTRTTLQQELARAKIIASGPLLAAIMMHAELEGLICSGPRIGKEFSYALLDERVPAAKKLDRDEALASLTRRYFISRGPAMLQDFVWWSGLTVKEARQGIDSLGKELRKETVREQQYILAENTHLHKDSVPAASFASSLMPDYDEYVISYKDRSAITNEDGTNPSEKSVLSRMIVVQGRIVGSWRATIANNSVQVKASFFSPLSKIKQQAVQKAINRYKAFVLNKG